MNLDHEIEVMENIIRVLKRCLRIHLKEKDLKGTVRTLNDIRIVKREIKRVIDRAESEQEPQNETQRSGKVFY
jgi:hypothetical protein